MRGEEMRGEDMSGVVGERRDGGEESLTIYPADFGVSTKLLTTIQKHKTVVGSP